MNGENKKGLAKHIFFKQGKRSLYLECSLNPSLSPKIVEESTLTLIGFCIM